MLLTAYGRSSWQGVRKTCYAVYSALMVRPRPTQVCTFVGSRSMLRIRLTERIRLTQQERKATVIVRLYSWEAWPQFRNRPTGMVVV